MHNFLTMLTSPLATHLIVAVVFFLLGKFFDDIFRQKMRGNRIEIDWRRLLLIIFNFSVVITYMVFLIHMQFYGGAEPVLVFSAMASLSFGSLVGERDFFVRIIEAVKKK